MARLKKTLFWVNTPFFMVKIEILLPFLESLAKTTATDRKPNIKLPTLKICFIVVPTLVLHWPSLTQVLPQATRKSGTRVVENYLSFPQIPSKRNLIWENVAFANVATFVHFGHCHNRWNNQRKKVISFLCDSISAWPLCDQKWQFNEWHLYVCQSLQWKRRSSGNISEKYIWKDCGVKISWF